MVTDHILQKSRFLQFFCNCENGSRIGKNNLRLIDLLSIIHLGKMWFLWDHFRSLHSRFFVASGLHAVLWITSKKVRCSTNSFFLVRYCLIRLFGRWRYLFWNKGRQRKHRLLATLHYSHYKFSDYVRWWKKFVRHKLGSRAGFLSADREKFSVCVFGSLPILPEKSLLSHVHGVPKVECHFFQVCRCQLQKVVLVFA
jgi:hypothetical protein